MVMNITKEAERHLLCRCHGNTLALQFLSVKNQMFLFATFESWPEIIAKITNGSHIVLTLPITLVGVNDPCLGILVVIKTEPAA